MKKNFKVFRNRETFVFVKLLCLSSLFQFKKQVACMARYMKWIGVLAGVLLVISCFTPWVIIESQKIVVRGVDTTGTDYGKPAYLHFVLTAFFLALTYIQKIWAKRFNLLVTAINIAWAARNYFVLTTCAAGECPVSQLGLWLMMISSALMLLSSFFPDIELPENRKNS